MNTESSQETERIRRLEQLIQQLAAQVRASEVRLASVEQGSEQLGAALGFLSTGGSGNVSPAQSTSTISAFTGGVPGSGTATVYAFAGGALTSIGTQTVHSMFSTAIASGKNLVVEQDSNANYWVLSGDC